MDTQPNFFNDDELLELFNLDNWGAEGKAIRAKERSLAKSRTAAKAEKEAIQFEWGEWMLEAHRAHAANKIKKRAWKKQAAWASGYAFGTLQNWANVAATFETPRRVVRKLPFSIFQEISKFEDEKVQEELLDLAEKGEAKPDKRTGIVDGRSWTSIPMSVRELQKAIRVRQEAGKLPGPYEPKKDKHEGKQLLEIWVNDATHRQLCRWSNAKYTQDRPASMLLWMAGEYAKEHKADLEAMVEADKAERARFMEENRKRVEENDARSRKKGEELAAEAAAKGMTMGEFISYKREQLIQTARRENSKPLQA
jgi:hypothetical protein